MLDSLHTNWHISGVLLFWYWLWHTAHENPKFLSQKISISWKVSQNELL